MNQRHLACHLSLAFCVCLPCSLPVHAQAPGLLVSNRFGDNVLLFDANGKFVRKFATGGGLDNPVGITFGPRGLLYVVSANNNRILRYDGKTGAFKDVFVGSGLNAPRNLNFGPDGDLFVCNGRTAQVLRFDGRTGKSKGVFAQHATITAPTSLTFGPDGNLYVGSVLQNHVVRFHGLTGQFIGVFASTGIAGAHDLGFGPDGDLYVSNAFQAPAVVRFDGRTGKSKGAFVQDSAQQFPLGLSWDVQGHLLVVNQGRHEVRRYDGKTGKLLGVLVNARSGGLDAPLFATFVRGNALALRPPSPAKAGSDVVFAVEGGQAGGLQLLVVGTRTASIRIACFDKPLGIGDPLLLTVGLADEGGLFVHRLFVPGFLKNVRLLFQPFDFSACRSGSTVSVGF